MTLRIIASLNQELPDAPSDVPSDAPSDDGRAVPPGPATFQQVYAEHFPFVWRCLRALGVPPEGLDDAAQDAFLVVHRRLHAFSGQSALRTWLYGIVRNVASNHRRTIRRKDAPRELVGAAPDLPSAAAGPLESAQDREAAAFLENFLAALDTKKREVFFLAAVEQMGIPEVAAALSIPLNTAYTRLRAARAEFERALARHRGSP